MNTDKLFHELLEAARQVVYFAGPTPENTKKLRELVDACDESDRSTGYAEEEEEEEEDVE